MTFLNHIVLFGLAAIAIPILIHLLHRGRAKIVDWGAMRFLLASLASRSRRIMFEEIILLSVRCLLVSLVVLAVSRPFLPTVSTVPWGVVLMFATGAVLCLAVGTVMWSRRWIFYALAVILILTAVVACLWERHSQAARWSSGTGGQDIAIIIDASMSMELVIDGERNFDRAIDQARGVVASANAGDAISLILAGSSLQQIVAAPTSERKKLLDALDTIKKPLGGRMAVIDAISSAAGSLADGNNPAKLIVLITDGQKAGWQVHDNARWQRLAAAMQSLATVPRIIVRTLDLPRKYRNAAIADMTLDRKVVGTDRPVKIDVKVLNASTVPIESSPVWLTVNGRELPPQRFAQLHPNAAETVRFEYRFDKPGQCVISASLGCLDDLPGDNTISRVVNVIEKLPVLVVDGSPSARPLEGAGDFIALALAPAGPTRLHKGSDDTERYLADPTVIAAADITAVRDFGVYRLIVLADVAKLPGKTAQRIAQFVSDGGGLLIAPGRGARSEFYNHWKGLIGPHVAPANMVSRQNCGDKPLRLAPSTFNHPSLELVAEPAYCRDAGVRAYWRLSTDERDVSVRVAARLADGQPLLVERSFGKGRVLMSAIPLNGSDSNLPTLRPLFVPLVCEMAYYLAGAAVDGPNVPDGTQKTDPAESFLTVLKDEELSVPGENGLNIFRATTSDQMLAVVRGGLPGDELWRYLALGAMLVLLAEIILTRWIAIQRKSGHVQAVRFGERQ